MNLLKQVTRKIWNDYVLHTEVIDTIRQSHKLEKETKHLIESLKHYVKCQNCELKE